MSSSELQRHTELSPQVEKLRNECLVPGMLDESCALDTGIFVALLQSAGLILTLEVDTMPPTTEAMSPEWCLAFFKLGAAQCDGKTLIKAVQASGVLRLRSLVD